MKKIGFIGGYDKTDLMIYIAKILTTLGKKVLIIDSTIIGKARYIVPAISPAKTYITEFEEIDIAVGFSKMEEIEQYLGISEEQELEYDFIFVDTDNMKGVNNFRLEEANKNYFVTSFDVYSLKKGIEALMGVQNVMNMTKIYFSKEILKEEDDYLNFLSLRCKVTWDEERIYFPFENGDLSVIHENQRFAKIKFKKLSVQYKDGLAYLAEEISGGELSEMQIRRVIKTIEKGV